MIRIGIKKLINNGIKNNNVIRKEIIAIMKFSTRVNHVNNNIEDNRILLKKKRIIQEEKERMVQDITMDRMETAENVVQWFLNQMPPSYFKQVGDSMRTQHLKAIAAIHDLNQKGLTLKLVTPGLNGSLDVTHITSGCSNGLLFNQIDNLEIPQDHYLSNVRVYQSMDENLSLNVFTFDHLNQINKNFATGNEDSVSAIMKYIEEIKLTQYDSYMKEKLSLPPYSNIFSKSSMEEYFKVIPHAYLNNVRDYRRFLIIRSLYNDVKGTEDVAVHIEKFKDPTNATNEGAWISIATPNLLPEKMFRLVSRFMKAKNVKIHRAHLDNFLDPMNSIDESSYVTVLRLLVSPDPLSIFDNKELVSFMKDIKRTKWLDDEVIAMGLFRHPTLGVEKAEVIVALCSMLHGPLSKENNQSYASIKTLISILDKSPHFITLSNDIAQLFLDRFNPKNPLSGENFELAAKSIGDRISQLHLQEARNLLLKMLEAVKMTLRTNFYNENRYALSLRVNPTIMTSNSPTPYGVFFSHGRNFNAFHCRFRDIARGGLRIVTPTSSDQYALESSRQFDEAFGLSHAQQLKNKDIPEGGAKGVILVNPNFNANSKNFQIRKSVKAFTDSLLDLIVKDSVSNLVDYYKKDELIYLGPDEQVIPSDIDWICERAGQRGYPIPAAFMSSKKGAGINHKEYGVTSEGIVCYLDVALRSTLNINPKTDPFTIKITGGPDGDVAGNLIKILFREYGENCKVVGIADGFGVAEDPKGLDSSELLRLVKEALPITSFNREKLSPDGVLFDVVSQEGLTRRLTMCFRVKSDAFVPAGGRPNTINVSNWNNWMDSDGKPSSPLIVEGANIFITNEARALLWKNAGVQIVKDSSANKCGVITSSCEVMASMLLTKDEFMSIKEELVQDVVTHLKHVANLEANLLFREFNHYRGALPYFSERISEAINTCTDAITDALENVDENDPLFVELFPVMMEIIPKKLVEVAGDRIKTRFPLQYQKNAIACSLASKLVYNEGIHFVLSQSPDQLAKVAFDYYHEDLKMKKLLNEMDMDNLNPEQKKQVVTLLKKGGVRASMGRY